MKELIKILLFGLVLLLAGFAANAQGFNTSPTPPAAAIVFDYIETPDSTCIEIDGVRECLDGRSEAGVANVGSISPGWNSVNVTFSQPFATPPEVVATIDSAPPNHSTRLGLVRVRNITVTGCVIEVWGNQNTGGVKLRWIAK